MGSGVERRDRRLIRVGRDQSMRLPLSLSYNSVNSGSRFLNLADEPGSLGAAVQVPEIVALERVAENRPPLPLHRGGKCFVIAGAQDFADCIRLDPERAQPLADLRARDVVVVGLAED